MTSTLVWLKIKPRQFYVRMRQNSVFEILYFVSIVAGPALDHVTSTMVRQTKLAVMTWLWDVRRVICKFA